MRAGLLSLIKSMGWEAGGESPSWISSYSAGEKKGRKLISVSALRSWKEQQLFLSLASLSKTNRNYEHLYGFSTSNVVFAPSLTLPHNQASLELSYQGFPQLHLPLHHSPLEECFYDLLFEIANKNGPEEEGKEKCTHSEIIWSCMIVSRLFPDSLIAFLVDSRSIMFTIYINIRS